VYPLQAQQEVNFLRKFLQGGESWRVDVCSLRIEDDNYKRSSTLWGKRVHSQRKSWVRLWHRRSKGVQWEEILIYDR